MIFASFSFAVLLAVLLAGVVIRWKRKRQRRYAEYATEFFDAAEVVLSDPQAPESVRDMVRFVAKKIDDDHAAHAFFRVIRDKDDKYTPAQNARRERESLEMEEYAKVNPKGYFAYATALSSGLLAISQLDGFYGSGIQYAYGRMAKRHPNVGATVVRDARMRRPPDGNGLAPA